MIIDQKKLYNLDQVYDYQSNIVFFFNSMATLWRGWSFLNSLFLILDRDDRRSRIFDWTWDRHPSKGDFFVVYG